MCAAPLENSIALISPDVVNDYLNDLALCVEKACLNDKYPPADALVASVDMMAPEMNCNLYPTLKIHKAAGMPLYREFVRVSVDKSCAAAELENLAAWKDARDGEIYELLAAKRRYYETLLSTGPLLVERGGVYFRKIDKKTATALFRIVLDRINVNGTLERLTVELGQKDNLWGRGAVSRDDMDAAKMSESLQGTVYRMAGEDVEMIFIHLGDDPNIEVESVTKGTIGPFLTRHVTPEDAFGSIHDIIGDGAVLNIALSTASALQQTDLFNDPFHRTPTFSKNAREDLARLNRATYGVLTDRKFVTVNVPRNALREILRAGGTDNIIYEAENDG